jgi:hypothetical protein
MIIDAAVAGLVRYRPCCPGLDGTVSAGLRRGCHNHDIRAD